MLSNEPALLSQTAEWSFLDDGTDQGVAWRLPGFDDSAWAIGAGEFGYGDGDENTLISFGPSPLPKYTTTYFRTAFGASSIPSELDLRVKVDDGAVVYLNGVEAARVNMPAGEIDFRTLAPRAIWGWAERSDQLVRIDPDLLVIGKNVLAVEVHQNTRGSTDLSFLASLTSVEADSPSTTDRSTAPEALQNTNRQSTTSRPVLSSSATAYAAPCSS